MSIPIARFAKSESTDEAAVRHWNCIATVSEVVKIRPKVLSLAITTIGVEHKRHRRKDRDQNQSYS